MKDIKALIAGMTVEEKASLCSGKDFWHLKGIDRLGIPEIMVTDGPHGLRKQAGSDDHIGLNASVPATCFPTASALAATWNRDLVYKVGEAIAEECRQEEVSVILGPGVNIKRSPLCGRNFEYFSEDPYLTGEIASSHINGVQRHGVGTSLKHYAVNNQEYRRMSIDAVVDERALREIYLTGYEIAVKSAQPWTVMCSYNRINGTYASDHHELMTDILKKEWGHKGLVVTDWGAMNDRVAALDAGTELEMPGTGNGNDELIVDAVRSGQLQESTLDEAVERILNLIFRAQETLSKDYNCDLDSHHDLARRAAGEGVVLLKNENKLLPIPKDTRIALIGRFAKEPRYQGAGSSQINPTRLDNLYDEMVKYIGEENISYADGYTQKCEQPDEGLIREALQIAAEADIVVISAGLPDIYETEGLDRTHMKMPPGQDALIKSVANAHPKVMVVLSNGSPVEMPWVEEVGAVLEGYLGGQAGAGAIADILFGAVNPSGKLAESFPLKLEDTPSFENFPGGPATVEYRESIYVGYRYYDTAGADVMFPFGHGLSYTSFEYSNLILDKSHMMDSEILEVSLVVKNTGEVQGREIVQLYVRDIESTAFRPEKELKEFAKVDLNPGEETVVSFELDRRSFAYYDSVLGDWYVESGTFEVLAGSSSRDIRLVGRIEITSKPGFTPTDRRDTMADYYDLKQGKTISQANFESLLGKSAPPNSGPVKGSYDLSTPVGDMNDSFIGRLLYRLMNRQAARLIEGQEGTPTALLFEAMIQEMPLRGMLMMGEGPITRPMLEALLVIINGKYLKGTGDLFKAIFSR